MSTATALRRNNWRRSLAAIAIGLPISATFMASGEARTQPDDDATPLPPIQVSGDPSPGRAYNQPQMLVNPADSSTLAIVGANYNGGDCLAYVSRDDGRTWARSSAVARPSDYKTCVRPDLGPYLGAEFNSDGDMLLVSAADDLGGQQAINDLYFAKSATLGRNWDFSIVHEGKSAREFQTVDGTTKTGGEHFSLVRMGVDPSDPDYVYAGARLGHADRNEPYGLFGDIPIRAVVASSHDGGETWNSLTDQASDMEDVYGTYVPEIAVGSDGTVYAFARERTPPEDPEEPADSSSPPGTPGAGGRLLMSKSTDHGETWETQSIDDSAVPCSRCQWIPTATIDPRNDNLYVTFNQRRDEDSRHTIWFTRSTDGGDTWSELVELHDGDSDRDAYFPGISVAPNGRVDVAWHDFRTDAEPWFNPSGERGDEVYWDIYYTYSNDDGQTWAPNMRISDRSMHRNEGYSLNNNAFLSGPMGIASQDHAAYITWADSRRGTVESPVEDFYFSQVIHGEGDGGASVTGWPSAWTLILSLGLALVLTGVLLISAVLFVRRSRQAGTTTA